MYPTELPTAPGGGHPLSLATRWARDMAAMRRGSVTTMCGCRLFNRCRRRRCRSDCPPPPPSPPSPPGGIAGPVLTCRIMSTLQVSPPHSHAWRVLSAPCATMSVGDDGRPSAPTSGPRQRPPPPPPAPLRNGAVVAVVIRCRRVVPPPLPSNRRRYARFAESSGFTAVEGSALP